MKSIRKGEKHRIIYILAYELQNKDMIIKNNIDIELNTK